MATTCEFNLLIIFQVYDDHVFDSAIHSHVIFGCEGRDIEKVGYGLCVVVKLNASKNI